MTLYDSSVLIDCLADIETAVEYIDEHWAERAVAPPLVLFEIYQGEVFKSGPTDLAAVDGALAWLTVVDETRDHARVAAELQADLQQRGEPLSARDAFIAGTAKALGERLVVADADFDVEGIHDALSVEVV